MSGDPRRILWGGGYYISVANNERDLGSAFLHAEKDLKLSTVFEFDYQKVHDGYVIMCVSFKMGPGMEDGFAATWCVSHLTESLCLRSGEAGVGQASCMARYHT